MNRIPKAVYTKEFREEAVKLALTQGVGVSEAARRLSIPMALSGWGYCKDATGCVKAQHHEASLNNAI
ncbi:transposase-like protein [Paraburkholderia sp. JPY465]